MFVLCALGWTFVGLALPAIGTSPDVTFAATLRRVHISMLCAFVGGIFSFMATLGLSGWVHSRTLGIASSSVAFVAATAFVLLVRSL